MRTRVISKAVMPLRAAAGVSKVKRDQRDHPEAQHALAAVTIREPSPATWVSR